MSDAAILALGFWCIAVTATLVGLIINLVTPGELTDLAKRIDDLELKQYKDTDRV